MKTLNKNQSAFTLLELLVALFIISIIISLSVIVYDVAWAKSRNSKRVSDIIRIQNALETYHQQEGKYPNSITFGGDLIGAKASTTYLIGLPENPRPRNDGICPDSEYIYSTSTDIYSQENFYLEFCISSKADKVEAGTNCADNQGITSGNCPN